ncbi:MAG: DUF1697 domain-containing protein [Casimicrobiaceae bacterium]
MTRFVALLRGVNVGAAKRVPMADLRALLAALGYTGVQTLLHSGNAVFESSGRSTTAHSRRIQTALAETLGVAAPVIVKSGKEIAAIEAGNALLTIVSDPSRLLVAFTGEADALQGLAALSALVRPPERLHLGDHAAYLWCASGILESKAGAALLGKLGRTATTRNWGTVLKIAALLRQNGA